MMVMRYPNQRKKVKIDYLIIKNEFTFQLVISFFITKSDSSIITVNT